jgi:pilus assembly protein Flp/PilA
MTRPSPRSAKGDRAVNRRRRLRTDARGTSSVEYGLILAFIVLAMFGALVQLADRTKALWNDVSTQVTTAR